MTNTMRNGEWNAQAEASMMGYPIRIESTEHLTYLVRYCLRTLKGEDYREAQLLDSRAAEIVENAQFKYNSSKDKTIKWYVVNDSMFGVMMTFVRDKGELTLKNGKMKSSGVLAWVENVDAPDCSELGYVFFEKRNGKTVRIG